MSFFCCCFFFSFFFPGPFCVFQTAKQWQEVCARAGGGAGPHQVVAGLLSALLLLPKNLSVVLHGFQNFRNL